MAEKRHTFIFSTPAGEVQVSTDDLQELSRHAWFTQYFNAIPSGETMKWFYGVSFGE